jgi:hypothetical protein
MTIPHIPRDPTLRQALDLLEAALHAVCGGKWVLCETVINPPSAATCRTRTDQIMAAVRALSAPGGEVKLPRIVAAGRWAEGLPRGTQLMKIDGLPHVGYEIGDYRNVGLHCTEDVKAYGDARADAAAAPLLARIAELETEMERIAAHCFSTGWNGGMHTGDANAMRAKIAAPRGWPHHRPYAGDNDAMDNSGENG